jgi:carboxymethylenebutenolidase
MAIRATFIHTIPTKGEYRSDPGHNHAFEDSFTRHLKSARMTSSFVQLGGDLRGYYAIPAGEGPFPGVLLYQEAFGVNDYIQSEVRRLAANGYAAIAPDFFRGKTFSYDEFPKLAPLLKSLTRETLMADIDAAIAYLDAQPNVKHESYGAVGFCLGGRLAAMSALYRPQRVTIGISFYGGGIAPDTPRFYPPLLDDLAQLEGELVLIYGADDDGITPAERARITEALSREKKRFTLSVYPGAPHGFASRDRDSYRPEQAEAAWAQTLEALARTIR